MSLAGKVAIVTGGSRGIGAGIALELGRRGARLVITYTSSAARADEVVETIKKTSDPLAIKADCTDLEAPSIIVSASREAFGDRIDIIINNAGAGDELNVEDVTPEHFHKVFMTNVRMPMLLLQACLSYLQKGGRIVNLSSITARQGWAMQSAYGASKACMESLARTCAVELGQKYGITVNAVNPGPVATDMWKATPADAVQGIQSFIQSTPASPRVGEIDDIVPIVVFLCEEGSRWVTGSTICANGGTCFV